MSKRSKPARSKPAKSKSAKSKSAKSAKSKLAKPKLAKSKSPVKPASKPAPKSTHAKSPQKAAASAKAASATPANAASPRRRAVTPSKSPVVQILESKEPLLALGNFLGGIGGVATLQEGQIGLGSAQLMLLPIAREARGGRAAAELIDLVLGHWNRFPDRAGFHAQEFLRNAFAAVGEDAKRIDKLVSLVPDDASAELRFNIACAFAIAGDKPAMLAAVERALETGASAAQIRRDTDFDAFARDDELAAILDRAAEALAIPVDIAPYLPRVRAAVNKVVATLQALGETVTLGPPATLDKILAVERDRGLALPNDFRALLTIHDGMELWEHSFLGTADYRGGTELDNDAREYLESSADYGTTGIDDCIPLANWGQPNSWLLYDPRGGMRGGEPGYVIMLTADEWPQTDLVEAFANLEKLAKDVLGAN